MSRKRGRDQAINDTLEVDRPLVSFSWDVFDKLPRWYRMELAFAPFDYFDDALTLREIASLDINQAYQFVRRARANFGYDVHEQARALYGPTHPQAEAPVPWRAV